MRRIVSSVVALTLLINLNVGIVNNSDFTSREFWSAAGKCVMLTVSNDSLLSNAFCETVYYDRSESTNPCIALKNSFSDNGKYNESALKTIWVGIDLKNAEALNVGNFKTRPEEKEGSQKADYGTFSYSWNSFPSSQKQGIYNLYFIFDSLSAKALSSAITAEIKICDSNGNLNSSNGNYDKITFPQLSLPSGGADTTKNNKKSKSTTQKSVKHSYASTTASGKSYKSSKSGKTYSGKVKLGSKTSSKSDKTAEFEEYAKTDVISPQAKENGTNSALRIAEICAGTVALGCAAAIILSVVLKKHKKVPSQNETEK